MLEPWFSVRPFAVPVSLDLISCAKLAGLSWLIGGSLAEVLTSIIFLFVKHPFDVGDRVNVAKESYTVKEIRLLSTIFLDSNGVYVQAPNTKLNSEVGLVVVAGQA